MNPLNLIRTILIAGIACSVGCSPARATVYPVFGRVIVNGRPAAHAMIVFHPLDVPDTHKLRPVAMAGPDGEFRVMSYETADGAPAGEYAVTVIWSDPSFPHDCENECPHDRLKGTCADSSHPPWRVAIRPGPNVITLTVPLERIPAELAVPGNQSKVGTS